MDARGRVKLLVIWLCGWRARAGGFLWMGGEQDEAGHDAGALEQSAQTYKAVIS
jgi:hypothetical protein